MQFAPGPRAKLSPMSSRALAMAKHCLFYGGLLLLSAMCVVCGVFGQNAVADSLIVNPASGFSAEDMLSDITPETWSVFSENMAIYRKSTGLALVDPSSGSILDSLGKPADYVSQYLTRGIWAGFITPDPDGQSLWVGFTITGDTDDRIYQVSRNGEGNWEWVQRATLAGNFDLEFYNGNAYASANPGSSQSTFKPWSKIYQLDLSGNNNHAVIADVGGYCAGLGVDGEGNIYYGTYNLDGDSDDLGLADNKMYRFSRDQVAAAVDLGSISLDEAEALFDITGYMYDVDVDAADHLAFTNKINSSTSTVSIWMENTGKNGEDILVDIASGTSSFPYLTRIYVEGDLLTPQGKLFVTNTGHKGIAELSAERLAGDANLDRRVDDVDAAILAANWGATAADWSRGDFNDSGTVDRDDAALMAENWQKSMLDVLMSQAAATSVPEPSVVLLVVWVGVVAGSGLRRRKITAGQEMSN